MHSLWTLGIGMLLGTLGPYWIWRPPTPLFTTIAIMISGIGMGILYADGWLDDE